MSLDREAVLPHNCAHCLSPQGDNEGSCLGCGQGPLFLWERFAFTDKLWSINKPAVVTLLINLSFEILKGREKAVLAVNKGVYRKDNPHVAGNKINGCGSSGIVLL